MTEGKVEGKAEGIAEGKVEERAEMVATLLKNFSVEQVADMFNFSKDYVSDIARRYGQH